MNIANPKGFLAEVTRQLTKELVHTGGLHGTGLQ